MIEFPEFETSLRREQHPDTAGRLPAPGGTYTATRNHPDTPAHGGTGQVFCPQVPGCLETPSPEVPASPYMGRVLIYPNQHTHTMTTTLTQTENGALQLRSSGSACLDFFAEAGSARALSKTNPQLLEDMFLAAYAEDPATATLILYWLRAVRLGAGERNVFHVLHRLLFGLSPEAVRANLPLLGELGYYKDYVRVAEELPELEADVVRLFAEGVRAGDYYACKWLPRRHRLYALVRRELGMTGGDFRRHVAACSATVEQQLCARKLEEVEYAKLPSLALRRYRKLFLRQDRERFLSSLEKEGVNASVLFPHEVFPRVNNPWKREPFSADEAAVINAQWAALPDYLEGGSGILTVLDTSGSMTWRYGSRLRPYEVAYPLALYCAERVAGPFRNQIIEFSSRPHWIDLSKQETPAERMVELGRYCEVANTDVAAVFRLILERARAAKLPAEEMPACVLILSDMQFDEGVSCNVTLMDELRAQYKYAGYAFPSVVYWNLAATNTGVADKENCALISGFSPRILQAVLACRTDDVGASLEPQDVMQAALEPLRDKVDVGALVPLLPVLACRDFNPTRGSSARL